MEPKIALHTAARRYCADRFPEWTSGYEQLQAKQNLSVEGLFQPGWTYSDEEYKIFPRYRLDSDTQVEVEKLRPELTSTLEDLRVQLRRTELLRSELTSREIRTVFQLRELGSPDYEIELESLIPRHANGGEQYCTSQPLDWLVYASHEPSFTITGEWLVEAFKSRWPDWLERQYGGPFSTDDLKGAWETK